ncbi:hypothetical protein [Rhodococcus rhodnii]|uniref:Uncharacterized protein n=1 Tax=Rhodococcus rhodnii LMG 5362 TaxID=1273125 RepID=R7WQM2_9NOCA|nr:hypothetical protein [Rhodococcus rhodnii]EOM77608.1 hypothetical protein Rrhod_1018 [Rhodococcus rhodnii LMG 5362]
MKHTMSDAELRKAIAVMQDRVRHARGRGENETVDTIEHTLLELRTELAARP